jgi:hypothetical protein
MEGITPISKGDFAVNLKGPEGLVGQGTFHLTDLGGSCKLTLEWNGEKLSATSSDFFDALVQIRRRLEKNNLVPVCYGASRNVFPTDLSRAMAHGLMAPRWEQGKRTPESLVFLFHSGVDVDPVTVSEQRETHQKWVAELPVIMPLKDDAPMSRLAA